MRKRKLSKKQKRLILEHDWITRRIAESFYNKYRRIYIKDFEFEDLHQVAREGLIKAVVNFREDMQKSFAVYMIKYIRGEIQHFLRNTGLIKKDFRSEKSSGKIYIQEIEDIISYINGSFKRIDDYLLLQEIFQKLTLHDRNILWLYYIQDLKQVDIAKLMNISQRSVSKEVNRAIRKARRESGIN